MPAPPMVVCRCQAVTMPDPAPEMGRGAGQNRDTPGQFGLRQGEKAEEGHGRQRALVSPRGGEQHSDGERGWPRRHREEEQQQRDNVVEPAQ